MSDSLSHADLVFVVDTTGSMGGFLAAAKRTLIETLERLSSREGVSLSVGLVEYRDHPPQERSFVTRQVPIQDDRKKLQSAIDKLGASGGGDAPEAVYQGVFDACTQLKWRPHSARFLLLVGDAPPHAYKRWHEARTGESLRGGLGDHWPESCPSGLDPERVSAAAEEANIRIFGICMSSDAFAQAAFSMLSGLTGGESHLSTDSSTVIARIGSLLERELADVSFDRDILALAKTEGGVASAIAAAIGESEHRVASSLARLSKRGFLD